MGGIGWSRGRCGPCCQGREQQRGGSHKANCVKGGQLCGMVSSLSAGQTAGLQSAAVHIAWLPLLHCTCWLFTQPSKSRGMQTVSCAALH